MSLQAASGTVPAATRPRLGRALEGALRLPLVPLAMVAVIVFFALFAPLIAAHDPLTPNLLNSLKPPSSVHWFGTDDLGRDIWTRIMYGARVSVIVASSAMALGVGIGVTLAVTAGYLGGALGGFIMRLTDAMLTIPGILVALMFVVAFGPGLKNIIVVIGILQWPGLTRLLYGEVLSLKDRDYVVLARVAGAKPIWIMARHILPNIANTVIVLATLDLGTVILFEAALSFLGLGIPPPTPAWGLMTAEGRQYLASAWWIATLPGMAIAYTVLAVNLLGDWLRDALDPLRRQV